MLPAALAAGGALGAAHAAYDVLLRWRASRLLEAERRQTASEWGPFEHWHWPKWLPVQPIRDEAGKILDTRQSKREV